MKKRDGRLVSRAALEEMRLMALQRMGEGESPAEVASSFGFLGFPTFYSANVICSRTASGSVRKRSSQRETGSIGQHLTSASRPTRSVK